MNRPVRRRRPRPRRARLRAPQGNLTGQKRLSSEIDIAAGYQLPQVQRSSTKGRSTARCYATTASAERVGGSCAPGPRLRKSVASINNSSWKRVLKNVGLPSIRVHDLKHTFWRRLRAAGMAPETRKVLLGHRNGDITTHYSSPELEELIGAASEGL